MIEQTADAPIPEAPPRSGESAAPGHRILSSRVLIGAALALFATVTFVRAWASDDAYITFRVIENFFGGHGLRWNISERVQVYTHPLWMLLLLPARALAGEIYFSSLFLSLALSWTTAWLIAVRIAAGTFQAVLALVLFSLSHTFADFSTSGLENPLSHLLLALFLLRSLTARPAPAHLFQLGLLACLGMLNRLDLALIFAPTLALWLLRARSWRAAAACLAGFLPLALWETFSLFYYGFPFPNTAYAKLGNGIPPFSLMFQGLQYYRWSAIYDVVSLITIASGFFSAPFRPRPERLPALAAAAGVLLYLLYILKIGGDFMGGRFFTAPFLIATCLIARRPASPGLRTTAVILSATAVVIAMQTAVLKLMSGGADGLSWSEFHSGVVNERLIYFHGSGLLHAAREKGPTSQLPSVLLARQYRAEGRRLVTGEQAIGYLGYFGGPEIHILDPVALSDPLLARLPAVSGNWRIGHFFREIPAGYVETLRSGRNVIQDPSLAEFYDRLSLVTRGPLWSAERWKEIWRFNTGGNQHLVQAYLAAAAQHQNR